MDGYTNRSLWLGDSRSVRSIRNTEYEIRERGTSTIEPYNEVKSINKNGVPTGTHQKCNELKHEITRLFMRLRLQLRTVWRIFSNCSAKVCWNMVVLRVLQN